MPQSSASVVEYTPADLGLVSQDLKAAANTVYTATTDINIAGFSEIMFTLVVVNTGAGTVGAAELQLEAFALDGTTKLVDGFSIATAIVTNTAGTTAANVGFGGSGAAAGRGATIVAATSALRALVRIKPRIKVTTANDGTTSVGSLYVHLAK